MNKLPINWNDVDWQAVGILTAIAFLAAIIGNVLSFGSRLAAVLLTTVAYAALYIGWAYYLKAMVLGPAGG